jgi:Family of unknown function (DUF5677)
VNSTMSIESTVAEIDRIEIDDAIVSTFTRESDFFRLAFALLRETSGFVCVFASVGVGERPMWDSKQAVVGGHLVRLFKLLRILLEATNQDRAELLWVILRLAAECVINFRFLLSNHGDEVVSSYLHQSLQHERDLVRTIRGRIEDRGGVQLPIEARMLRSIQRTFVDSQVTIDSLPEKRIRNWGGKNVFEKAGAVGLEDAYLAIFGGPSRNVHGGWRDLLEHHLHCEAPGQFTPELEFSRVRRPQPLFATAAIIVPGLIEYIECLGAPELQPLKARLRDLDERIRRADDWHERYLQQRPNNALEPSAPA